MSISSWMLSKATRCGRAVREPGHAGLLLKADFSGFGTCGVWYAESLAALPCLRCEVGASDLRPADFSALSSRLAGLRVGDCVCRLVAAVVTFGVTPLLGAAFAFTGVAEPSSSALTSRTSSSDFRARRPSLRGAAPLMRATLVSGGYSRFLATMSRYSFFELLTRCCSKVQRPSFTLNSSGDACLGIACWIASASSCKTRLPRSSKTCL